MSGRRFSSAVSWPRGIAYVIAAVVAGVVLGELTAMLIFAGASDRRLDDEAMRAADAAPAVVAVSNDLGQTRQARTALDDAVERASRERDEALVIARCEFSAAPQCPQTHITGVPGTGPEHRTADAFLEDAQRELDRAEGERDQLASALDAEVVDREHALTAARDAAIASADRGFGARWLAMNAHTLASPGATVLRALVAGLFVLLLLFPLILRLSRTKTTEDRRAAAHAERERADLQADTAIAVKQAEVRAVVQSMWAEHQLATARLAVAAQTEIDREEQRRRVAAALEAPIPVPAERIPEVVAELPAASEADPSIEAPPKHLPAVRESRPVKRTALPDVAGTAIRWVRPFVPPIIATAIDTTTKPLRAVREVFEETEEIHFSLRRSHRVTVTSEEPPAPGEQWVEAARVVPVAEATTAVEGPKRLTRNTARIPDGTRQLPSSDG